MKKFPNDFVWGSSTSSYQIEGGVKEGGRGPSIWDAFCMIPGRTRNEEDASVSCDHFHKWKEDIGLMKDMGLKAYRFSISWSRILPDGKGKPNPEGIQFYSDIIDELIRNDIKPWITLYHWDLPLALEMEEDGWLNPAIIDSFANYASICFDQFGDRVKWWITLNEPWVVAMLGYGQGVFAPGKQSTSKPYLAAHHLLLAHARAVEIYRSNYQSSQKGSIGISNNCDWREPLTDSEEDKAAAERALEFYLGWFADPIFFGDYPRSMRDRVGDRLPRFSQEEMSLMKGSTDFMGLNHYTTMYASHIKPGEKVIGEVYGNGGISEDQDVRLGVDALWKKSTMGWAIVPWGCRKLLNWIDHRYGSPDIYITENGCSLDDKVVRGKVDDSERIEFFKGYMKESRAAIEDGVRLKGFFVWSLLDNFEWALGYSKRFGLHHVNFKTLKRTPKASASWFKKVIKNNGL